MKWRRSSLWIVLSLAVGCSGAAPPVADRLILRGRTAHTGALRACSATDCSLDDETFARERIEWIGLRGATSPPTADTTLTDQVFFDDGRSAPGRLVEVSDTHVVMNQATYRRGEVRWVHLAASASATGVENWTGVVASTTARVVKDGSAPGSPTARVCHADFRAQFAFTVNATGSVSGR